MMHLCRALVFPPVNNYRRYIIHQLVQDRFPLLQTFSIGQGLARRTVVCYKSDMRSDWKSKPNALEWKTNSTTKQTDTTCGMGVEDRRSLSTSPECKQLQRQAKSVPSVEIYRPPAARRASNSSETSSTQVQSIGDSSSIKNARQKRPDRAVYVPRHRRSLEVEEKKQQNPRVCPTRHAASNKDSTTNNNSKLDVLIRCTQQGIGSSSSNKISKNRNKEIENNYVPQEILKNVVLLDSGEISDTHDNTERYRAHKLLEELEKDVPTLLEEKKSVATDNFNENSVNSNLLKSSDKVAINNKQLEIMQETVAENESSAEHLNCNDVIAHKNEQLIEQNIVSDVLVISADSKKGLKHSEQVSSTVMPPEKKVKKIERQKSKPVPPPSPPLKINRDECDWDNLFDDNGDCLDPTLIEELTSAVGEVAIEQPNNHYKTYSKQVEVSSDEFAHVIEIYNFPSEFKTSDLAAVFSSFKNGGFELKWVDDTHCLGVFSSPLVAAEVLASNHPFVKTRPLSEATALSKAKARKSAEFLQPYRNRPETCAALARRLVTGALGVKLATAREEREHEKNVLREAKEKKRLANKQREDVWEGIIPAK
ncbi:R3H and coiled-coil domain-containing protein 1 isoform X2 [Linepithema humile]|uniref:R3H and coiled-coil domain-containing protein 1 isoform X2 n=1 Tax=Linepithema humile TaxID=83485 RepID=UPI00351F0875